MRARRGIGRSARFGLGLGASLMTGHAVMAAIQRARVRKSSRDERLSSADAVLRIVSTIDDYLYTNEHCEDGSRRSVFSGPNREKLMGGPLPADADAANAWERMIHRADFDKHLAHRERLRAGRKSEVRYRLVGYDGVTRWIHAKTKPSHVDGRVFVDGIVSDVTAEVARDHELAEAQEALHVLAETNAHQALHDALTELGNRRKLIEDLERCLVQKERSILVMFDLNGFKQYNDAFGHPAGDALLQRLSARLGSTLSADAAAYRLGGDEFCVLRSLESSFDIEAWLAEMTSYLAETGEGFEVAAALGAVFLPDEATTTSAALQVADQRLYAEKRRESTRRGRPQELLLRALFEREPDLYAHTKEVAELTVAIAVELGLDPVTMERAEQAAFMHDVGKIAIPDALLQKPGPLDDNEWELIRQHTLIGERILAAAPALASIAPIVRSTHERWDGKGYPDGLSGEATPVEARIVSACDAYSAMIHGRPYGAPRTESDALAEVMRCAGSQFDPSVVAALRAVLASAVDAALDL
jgi:diguanylate cyclase (GGDEF)-like protein/putative nucleotidyltransferase with HDIG domain